MQKYLLTFIISFTSLLNVFAQETVPPTDLLTQETQAQISVAQSLLTKDLLAASKTISTEKKIFNYFFLQKIWNQLESESGRHEYTHSYMSQRAGSFWNSKFNDDSPKNYAAGPGLYFAIDPLISKDYGNTFIEIKIPGDIRFINVVHPIPLKKETIAALISEGIINADQVAQLFPKRNGFYRDTLRVMVKPAFTHFRKLVQNIFTANDIQFIEYNFNSSLGRFCTKHSYSAFNYIGKKNTRDEAKAVVDESFQRTSLFSTEMQIPHLSSGEVQQFDAIVKFRTVLEHLKEIGRKGREAAKAYILSQYPAEEYAAVKQSTYSCE